MGVGDADLERGKGSLKGCTVQQRIRVVTEAGQLPTFLMSHSTTDYIVRI